MLVNGRMSARSGKRWAWLSSLSKPVFSRFDLVLTQDWHFAKRLRLLGVRKAIVAGNLKYDAPPPPVDAGAVAELRARVADRPIFLAAARIRARTKPSRAPPKSCKARCHRF